MKLKICPVCGQVFQKQYGRQRYCSPDCRIKYNRTSINRVCIVCGEKFKGYSRAKYCSKECKDKAVYKCRCKVCGKEFFGKRPNSVFCTKKCYAAAHYKHRDGTERGCMGRQHNKYPNLEAERKKRGMTRGAFSDLLGITVTTYANRQSGRTKGLKDSYWENYANILGVSVEYLKEEKTNA